MNYLDKVKDFHNTFNAPVLDSPQIPSDERCKFRVSLLQEELNELSDGIKNGDIVEIADALCDLQYVLSGAILEFGLYDKFNELFDEVQRSNMSKACESIKEALSTLSYYKDRDGSEGFYKEKDGKYIVYRNDEKVLKSINYSPANLKDIING